MKKATFFLLCCLGLFACGNKKSIPDVSGIEVQVPVERFDRDFFAIDTNALSVSLPALAEKYPDFYPDFMQQILGVSGSDTNFNTVRVVKQFIHDYRPVYDSLQPVFNKTDKLQKELEQAFRFVKHYVPGYRSGKVVLFFGPFDAPGVANTRSGLAVGLQLFAGSDFFAYQVAEMQEMFPVYITRRFTPAYITTACMKAVVNDIYPDQSGGKPLVEQMVEKGKQWYMLDKFLPTTADSLKTGYTQHQLDWCRDYEGQIWSYIIKNEDLHSLSPQVIQTYVGESPYTIGLSMEDSPGNIGQWIGWQIVKKYASKNPGLSLEDLMKTDAKTILEGAKYKPK